LSKAWRALFGKVKTGRPEDSRASERFSVNSAPVETTMIGFFVFCFASEIIWTMSVVMRGV